MSLRIQFFRSGAAAPVDLAPGGKSSPEKMELSAATLDEIAEPLRAAEVMVFDHANFRAEFSFPVWREHTTVEAAFIFMLDHPIEVCGSGTLVWLADMGSGVHRREAAAHVKIAASDWDGVSTMHKYSVICGAIKRGTI